MTFSLPLVTDEPAQFDTQTFLAVSELFGPTFQGEGPSIGKPCFFLRLAGCSVQCSWCDTKYSWEQGAQFVMMTPDSIHGQLVAMWANAQQRINRLVISGGEPMQQTAGLNMLLTPEFRSVFPYIEIETSGVIEYPRNAPNLDFVQYNVSPKLKHANARRPYKIETLKEYARDSAARFKFVVENVTDFDELDDIVAQCTIHPFNVWVMPLGTERHEIAQRSQEIAQATVERGYNFTTRLHIITWGNRRGV